jgi:hypothetical protein
MRSAVVGVCVNLFWILAIMKDTLNGDQELHPANLLFVPSSGV